MSETFGHGARDRLVWVDVETTGLQPARDIILEVAVLVTDWNLQELGALSYVVRLEGGLPALDPVVFRMHARSGLLAELASDNAPTLEQVERELVSLVGHYGGPMAGATPSGVDGPFVRMHMPRLAACFDHRYFDVSTLKQAYRMWEGDWPKGTPPHRAFADLRGTVEECRQLRRWMGRSKLSADIFGPQPGIPGMPHPSNQERYLPEPVPCEDPNVIVGSSVPQWTVDPTEPKAATVLDRDIPF